MTLPVSDINDWPPLDICVEKADRDCDWLKASAHERLGAEERALTHQLMLASERDLTPDQRSHACHEHTAQLLTIPKGQCWLYLQHAGADRMATSWRARGTVRTNTIDSRLDRCSVQSKAKDLVC